jgi:RNA polymerase sigma-70 factor (ECF subfamily)
MAASQRGEAHAYARLFRELDAWLRRYYARRLPRTVAEDASQEALLAVHAARHTYEPARPFGAWLLGIARHKWIDCLRTSARQASLLASLPDCCDRPAENPEAAILKTIEVNEFLGRLAPAQAAAIRLVKLEGVSIDDASRASGQSTALIKVNIHRGLKRMAAMVARTPAFSNSESRPPGRT